MPNRSARKSSKCGAILQDQRRFRLVVEVSRGFRAAANRGLQRSGARIVHRGEVGEKGGVELD